MPPSPTLNTVLAIGLVASLYSTALERKFCILNLFVFWHFWEEDKEQLTMFGIKRATMLAEARRIIGICHSWGWLYRNISGMPMFAWNGILCWTDLESETPGRQGSFLCSMTKNNRCVSAGCMAGSALKILQLNQLWKLFQQSERVLELFVFSRNGIFRYNMFHGPIDHIT